MNWLVGIFSNPWALLWIPAATLPILIHLWNRQKYRERPWAAMEYLLAAIVKSSRRMRIEQLLLLAVRTLLILLVVLALAKPFLREMSQRFFSGARTHHVFVIDGSFSMDYRAADRSLFEMAKQRAVELVEAADEGDGFSLVLMAEAPRVIVGTPALDRSDFIEEIDNLKLLHGGANLEAALAASDKVVEQARQQREKLAAHRVYFLSDLGETTWAAGESESGKGRPLQARIDQLAAKAAMEVIPLVAEDRENLAVTRLWPADSFITTRQPVTLQVAVTNYGNQPRTQLPVELLVDGRSVAQSYIDVDGGQQSTPANFQYRFPAAGDHTLEARIVGDPVDVDNHRYLVLPVRDYVSALCVSGKQGSARFLARGLDPDYLRNTLSAVRPQIVSESALLELELARYDCLFLCNIGQLTSGEAQVLQSYVEGGGGLVIFLGDQVLPERYNRELGGELAGSVRLLPARLLEPSPVGNYRFDPLDYRHPLVRVWKANPDAGLLSTPIARYFRMQVPEQTSARVALAFDNGDPAIVEQAVGKGRVILVAVPASTSSIADPQRKTPWTLSAWHSYPVIFQELLRFAVGGQIAGRNVLVGNALGGVLETTSFDSTLIVRPPGINDAGESVHLDAAAQGDRWTFDGTDFSGVYTVSQDRPDAWQNKFAVNVDTRESLLTRISPEDLPKGFTLYGSAGTPGSSAAVVLTQPVFPRYLLLLCSALALALVEVALAWWIGNRSL